MIKNDCMTFFIRHLKKKVQHSVEVNTYFKNLFDGHTILPIKRVAKWAPGSINNCSKDWKNEIQYLKVKRGWYFFLYWTIKTQTQVKWFQVALLVKLHVSRKQFQRIINMLYTFLFLTFKWIRFDDNKHLQIKIKHCWAVL